MGWLATDKGGAEYIYGEKPRRHDRAWWFCPAIRLPQGSIRKLIGRDLTWKDEPVELKEEERQ